MMSFDCKTNYLRQSVSDLCMVSDNPDNYSYFTETIGTPSGKLHFPWWKISTKLIVQLISLQSAGQKFYNDIVDCILESLHMSDS